MKKLILPLLLIFGTTCAIAQTHKTEFGIQTDNDSYLGQGSDRYYTDGLFFFYNHALDVKGNAKLQNKIIGFELGQKIFNPRGGNVPSADFVDRPFAGYLYIGSTMNYLFKNESNLKLGAQLGVVGPASGAETAQTWVHKNFGFYTPTGWQYQIKNDVELNLSAQYNRFIARDTAVDFSLQSYVNLGTGFTGAGVGAMVRLGVFNQLFNSAATQSSVIADNSVKPLVKHEFYLYIKPMLNVIGYDATVQGSLFRSNNDKDPANQEITLDPKRLILSTQAGVTYTTNRWTFDVAAIFHTKDVEQMVMSHSWGSVTAFYKFN